MKILKIILAVTAAAAVFNLGALVIWNLAGDAADAFDEEWES